MSSIADNATPDQDRAHMLAALGLAARGLGRVWPNPAVGCVLAREGQVVGRGWTQPSGRPHAETEALRQAGVLAKDATAYVTLEPCSHHGKTPPCADALIEAGVRRVVVAVEDPDPRVSGAGLTKLRQAGIRVDVGLLGTEAADLNAGFFLKIRSNRPLVTLKLATTLDGRIATHTGQSQWITGEAARARGHLLRANHDAILVGSGTALADNPALNCRLPGLEGRSPVRVVVDGRLRLPLTSGLVRTAKDISTWVFTREDADSERIRVLGDCGVEVFTVAADADGRASINRVLAILAEKGITRLLAEGGAHMAAGLLRAHLVDRLVWFRSPSIMGGDGIPAATAFGVDRLVDLARFALRGQTRLDVDSVEYYDVRQ